MNSILQGFQLIQKCKFIKSMLQTFFEAHITQMGLFSSTGDLA